MATIQTIATTLTADHRPAVQSLRVFDAEVGKAFTRLDRLNKRAMPTGQGGELAAVGRGGTLAAQGLLEASRAAEDFAVGFGVNGVQGAIRGSLNNITQMAMILGGPLTGAIAGFTAAGVSALSPYIAKLFEAEDRTKRLAQETENLFNKARQLSELRVKEAEQTIEFRIELRGGDDTSVLDEINKRRVELDKLEGRRREIDQRQNPGAGGAENPERLRLLERELELRREIGSLQAEVPQERDSISASLDKRTQELERLRIRMGEMDASIERNNRFRVNDLPLNGTAEERAAQIERENRAEEEHSRLMQEKLELIRKETDLRVQIGQLRRREVELTKEQMELQRQRDADEFAAIIRNFQEEDARFEEQQRKERERDEERKRRKQVSDVESVEGMLKGRLQGLGGEIDPLEGMKIPDLAGDLKRERAELLEREGELVDKHEEEGWTKEWDKEMRQIAERRREIRDELEGLGEVADGPSLENRLRGVLGEVDELNKRPRAQLAQVATVDSQAMLRSQYQAKEAAERRKEAARLQKAIEDLLREIRDTKRKLEDEGKEDVGLT